MRWLRTLSILKQRSFIQGYKKAVDLRKGTKREQKSQIYLNQQSSRAFKPVLLHSTHVMKTLHCNINKAE